VGDEASDAYQSNGISKMSVNYLEPEDIALVKACEIVTRCGDREWSNGQQLLAKIEGKFHRHVKDVRAINLAH
jgi:hypothetical protein